MKGYSQVNNFGSVLNTIARLKSLNIVINDFGHVMLKDYSTSYAYKAMEEDQRSNEPFFLGVDNRDICKLALAEYQEESNNFIDQKDIDFVNYVLGFDMPITFDEVQDFNSKYI